MQIWCKRQFIVTQKGTKRNTSRATRTQGNGAGCWRWQGWARQGWGQANGRAGGRKHKTGKSRQKMRVQARVKNILLSQSQDRGARSFTTSGWTNKLVMSGGTDRLLTAVCVKSREPSQWAAGVQRRVDAEGTRRPHPALGEKKTWRHREQRPTGSWQKH